ncbi:acetyl-CoA acetyltransferase [Nocardiopsis mangrovi]|uniref:Acetyl-CoA acetyltransferase n=1 Tax=Nocardiopsis mangrovi TaxID=1179818 RepID=A0ABV9E0S1_9ACTN
MRRDGIADRAAITGIGMTPLTRSSGRTELALAADAAAAALADSGIGPDAVDAVLGYHLGDSAPATDLARVLGMTRLGWHNDVYGGGSQCASILGDAAMLIATGQAETVLVHRALNGRSGRRLNRSALRLGDGVEQQFTAPYGVVGPVPWFALAARRYLYDTGLTEDDLGAVVAASRRHAAANPRALRREPLTPESYLNSPMVADPLRRADCCQETDGACALVLTSADRPMAAGAPRVRAVVRGGRPGHARPDRSPDLASVFSGHIGPLVYRAAGMRPSDVDVALLYDAYSFLVPRQLTDFGLLRAADLSAALRGGAVEAGGGGVPVNPHGGLLSEGYVHGLNNVAEAVRQLRGQGTVQVPGAGVALCTGFGGAYGSAAILTAG